MIIIKFPQLNVNDNEGIVFWSVKNGDLVKKEQFIAQVETTKTLFDLSAPSNGIIYLLASDGVDISVGEPIAIISNKVIREDEIEAILNKSMEKKIVTQIKKKWTKKAELLAGSYGIKIDDIHIINDTIRESDILDFLKEEKKSLLNQNNHFENTDEKSSVNKQKRVIILGAGMAAMQALDIISRLTHIKPVGILDDDLKKKGKFVMGVPILNKIDSASNLWKNNFFDSALCLLTNSKQYRIDVFKKLKQIGVPFENIIDPSVNIHSNVSLGEGNLILADCRFGTFSTVGDNNFFSSLVNIAHHNKIGDHCNFGPGVVTSGIVTIGNNVRFATGIFVEPNIKIGDNCIIASGAILINSVPSNHLIKTKINTSMISLNSIKDEKK